MKSLILVILMLVCTITVQAQEKKNNCKDACCAEKNTAMKVNSKPVVCKLSSPELQKRKTEIIKSLKTKVEAREELANGYLYTFEGTDAMIEDITNFIKSERQCCAFFSFNMLVEDSIVKLSITGPEGTKDFIKNELDF